MHFVGETTLWTVLQSDTQKAFQSVRPLPDVPTNARDSLSSWPPTLCPLIQSTANRVKSHLEVTNWQPDSPCLDVGLRAPRASGPTLCHARLQNIFARLSAAGERVRVRVCAAGFKDERGGEAASRCPTLIAKTTPPFKKDQSSSAPPAGHRPE